MSEDIVMPAEPFARDQKLADRLTAARREIHAAAGSPAGEETWNAIGQALETLKADLLAILKE